MQACWEMRLKVRPILMRWRAWLPVDTAGGRVNSTPTTWGMHRPESRISFGRAWPAFVPSLETDKRLLDRTRYR